MSIKPIDFQVMIPKTAEISKIQNDQQQKNIVVNEQQTNTMRQKTEENVNIVHSRENAEKVRVDSEQEKKKDEKSRKTQTEPGTELKEKKNWKNKQA